MIVYYRRCEAPCKYYKSDIATKLMPPYYLTERCTHVILSSCRKCLVQQCEDTNNLNGGTAVFDRTSHSCYTIVVSKTSRAAMRRHKQLKGRTAAFDRTSQLCYTTSVLKTSHSSME